MADATQETPKIEAPTVTPDDARRVLLEEQQTKTAACQTDIDSVLRKHGCSLDVQMLVTTRGVQPSVIILPNPARTA